MEGLAIGPRLKDGNYVVVSGTDNDYSVTQNGSGQQFDVYFRFTHADPFAGSIQCPHDSLTGCFLTADLVADGHIDVMFDLPNDGSYRLLPGVLHAYRVTANDLGNFVSPVGHVHTEVDNEDNYDNEQSEE